MPVYFSLPPETWFSWFGQLATRQLSRLSRVCLAGWLLLLSATGAGAQNNPPSNPDLLPPSFLPKSPTVAALRRFDSQQLVNLPTGAAQLTVPVAEINAGSLRLPITLGYSYTGLQVGQPYDLVGLGWALQAGASITRQVNGLVDDVVAHDPTRRYNPDSVLTRANQQRYLKRALQNDVDTGPDMYSYSLPQGGSGRFVIFDTTIVLLPQQPVHIRRLGLYGGQGFQITTEDGVRYLFQAIERTNPNPNNFGYMGQHTTAWHLTRLVSADNTDTLRLHYTNGGFENLPQQCTMTTGQYYTGRSQVIGNVNDGTGGCGSAADYSFHNVRTFVSRVQAQYLDSITAPGLHLVFTRAANHELRRIRLLATTNGRREIKRVTLYQSVFANESAANNYRLRLDSLRESANGLALPAYRFRYQDAVLMPSRGSAAKDYWGYYNGATGNGDFNTTTTPTLLIDPRLDAQGGRLTPNREPNHAFAQAGVLQDVRYPTGGTTHWDYEPGRLPADLDDLPLVYQHEQVATGYDPNTALFIPGGPRLKASSSSVLVFQVLQKGDVNVVLHRQPNDDDNTTGGTNTYRDFNIWHRLPGVDTLITNSQALGAYQIYDGQGTERNYTFHLQPGTYTAQVYCEIHELSSDLSINIPYRDSSLVKLGIPGPGVRVLRTTTATPGAPPLVRTYRYVYNGHTSGTSLLPKAGKDFDHYEYTDVYASGGQMITTGYACQFVSTSSDNRGLGNDFNKYDFYYSSVTEEDGSQQGSTVHNFICLPQQFNDVVPSSQVVYRQDPGQPQAQQLAQQNQTTYAADRSTTYMLFLPRLAVSHARDAFNFGDTYSFQLYDVQASFVVPVVAMQLRYDKLGAALATATYSKYQQQRLVRTAVSTSTGWTIQRYKRLSDYTATPAVAALRKYHYNPVVETQIWSRPTQGPDSILIGGRLTLYDPTWRSPQSSWSLRLAQPAPGPNAEQQLGGQYAAFQSDTRYRLDESVTYHPVTGLLQERQIAHGTTTAYVWGYDHAQVVAQVENATYSQVLAALTQPVLDRLAGPNPGTDAEVRQLLAPLRTQLPAARITTYTFLPGVGLTSQTDPTGRASFYEYDALGRLLRIRDDQNRLISQQEYHYARP